MWIHAVEPPMAGSTPWSHWWLDRRRGATGSRYALAGAGYALAGADPPPWPSLEADRDDAAPLYPGGGRAAATTSARASRLNAPSSLRASHATAPPSTRASSATAPPFARASSATAPPSARASRATTAEKSAAAAGRDRGWGV